MKSARSQGVVVSDTTLRDGEQTYGIVFTNDAKLRIARLLDRLGLQEIEAGFPSASGYEASYLDALVAAKKAGEIRCRLLGWHRPIPSEIEWSARRGMDGCCASVPSSDFMIDNVLQKDRAFVLDSMFAAIQRGKQLGLYVVADFQDAFNADPGFRMELIGRVLEAGADRVRLCDTVGRTNPEGVRKVLETTWATFDVDLEVHAHNDLSMAVANCIVGAATYLQWKQAGKISADRKIFFSTAVNGIGERAGNTALEALVAALELTLDVDTGLDLSKLWDVCSYVETASRRPIPVNQPVVGSNNWCHSSGIHVDGVLKALKTYELISPEMVGRDASARRIGISKHSGRAALNNTALRLGFTFSEDELKDLMPKLAEMTVEANRSLSDQELRDVFQRYRERRP
jgi:homocitrate synthase NifV